MIDLTELTEVAARLAEGPGLVTRRNELIRQALAAQVPYKDLMEVTGLGRQQLDKIRRNAE